MTLPEVRVYIGETDVTDDINPRIGITITGHGREYELDPDAPGTLTFQLRPGAFDGDYVGASVRYEEGGETRYEGTIHNVYILWPEGGSIIKVQQDDAVGS